MAEAELIKKDGQYDQEVLMLSKADAAEIIAFLAGQLANHAIPNNVSNRSPDLLIMDRGQVVKRIVLCIDKEL